MCKHKRISAVLDLLSAKSRQEVSLSDPRQQATEVDNQNSNLFLEYLNVLKDTVVVENFEMLRKTFF